MDLPPHSLLAIVVKYVYVPDIQRVERLRDSEREETSRYVSQLTGEGHDPNKATKKLQASSYISLLLRSHFWRRYEP